MQRVLHHTTVELIQADLSTLKADALVNAANAALAGGGGVDGALHRAAGPVLYQACRALPLVAPRVRCPPGEVRTTEAGRLAARWVIHAVGPVYDSRDPAGSARVLASAWRAALLEALRLGARTVALPSLSTGAYRFPLGPAAQIAMQTVAEVLAAHPGELERVTVALFSTGDLAAYEGALGDY